MPGRATSPVGAAGLAWLVAALSVPYVPIFPPRFSVSGFSRETPASRCFALNARRSQPPSALGRSAHHRPLSREAVWFAGGHCCGPLPAHSPTLSLRPRKRGFCENHFPCRLWSQRCSGPAGSPRGEAVGGVEWETPPRGYRVTHLVWCPQYTCACPRGSERSHRLLGCRLLLSPAQFLTVPQSACG